MRHCHILRTAALVLLGWSLSAGSQAGCLDAYHYEIIVANDTPFPMKLIRSALVSDSGDWANHFRFSEEFADQGYWLEPDTDTTMGYAAPADSAIDGYFVFTIGNTEKRVQMNYQFVQGRCLETHVTLVDRETGQPYSLIHADYLYNSCYTNRRFPWFVPLSAQYYTYRCALRLTADEDAVACIEDKACTADKHRRAQQIKDAWTTLTRQEESARQPDKTVPEYSDPETLELNITFVNETPFPLQLTAHHYSTVEAEDDTSIRMSDAFNKKGGRVMPGASAPGAVSIRKQGQLGDYAVEAQQSFHVEGTGESFVALAYFRAHPLCQPKIVVLDTERQAPYDRIGVKMQNSCHIQSDSYEPVAGQQAHQDARLIFFVQEPGQQDTDAETDPGDSTEAPETEDSLDHTEL